MGEQGRYQIEAEFKRLSDTIKDQQDLLNKRECEFKEETTKLKANLELFKAKYLKLLKDQQEEVSKIRKFFRDKNQKLRDEVTSLRKEVNQNNTTIKNLRDRSRDYEHLEATTLSLKEELEETKRKNKDQLQTIEKQESQQECAFRARQMLQNVNEQQEKEILNLRQQVEEGRKSEEILKKKCLEKEEQHQVEVKILKGKLEEKDKLLRFQDSTKALDDILSSQRSPVIKTRLGFRESAEGESSSQGEARNSQEKSKMINKEMRSQIHRQSRKEIPQRKYFTPPMNNVECYVCHNLGHVAARCRRKRVRDHHAQISSHSRYFNGYCFACNMYGHKSADCYRRNMKHVRCYACNKFGHRAKDCRNKVHDKKKSSICLKVWKKKEVQSERCGTTQDSKHKTVITDSGGAESVQLQCPESPRKFHKRNLCIYAS